MAIDAPDTTPERTLGQLVASASQDVSTIIRKEVELAKTEVTTSVKIMGKGAGMLGAAGFFGIFAFGFLLATLAWGLVAAGLSPWLGHLIVAVLLLIIAGVLALIGKKALSRANPKPERAIAEGQATIAALKK